MILKKPINFYFQKYIKIKKNFNFRNNKIHINKNVKELQKMKINMKEKDFKMKKLDKKNNENTI